MPKLRNSDPISQAFASAGGQFKLHRLHGLLLHHSSSVGDMAAVAWFVNRLPCLVGIEACGGSQHCARQLQAMGHEVKLMSGKMVKAFVGGNKNDVADAHAIWIATRQPCIKAVAVKSEAQQALLAMHRVR